MSLISPRSIKHKIFIEELRELGAKVITIEGIMYHVKFKIGDTKLSYVYHLSTDNKYYLGRVKPYSMPIGDYSTEDEVIDFIKSDYKYFKNAMNSKNFNDFVEIDEKITKMVRNFEDLYLYYNVVDDDLSDINEKIGKILEEVVSAKSRAKTISVD